METVYTKDPSDVLDYGFDWTDWLAVATDTLSTSTWTADTGLTLDSHTNSTTNSTAWVSGGTQGNKYKLTNTVTTTASRTAQRTIVIKVEQK